MRISVTSPRYRYSTSHTWSISTMQTARTEKAWNRFKMKAKWRKKIEPTTKPGDYNAYWCGTWSSYLRQASVWSKPERPAESKKSDSVYSHKASNSGRPFSNYDRKELVLESNFWRHQDGWTGISEKSKVNWNCTNSLMIYWIFLFIYLKTGKSSTKSEIKALLRELKLIKNSGINPTHFP